jgi:hypothetical protein
MGTPRGVMVIDLFGLDAENVRRRFPEVYQHVKLEVKEKIVIREGKEEKIGRDWNNREYRRLNWWLFGENNPDFRKALAGLPRYITTVETAKHRVFQFLDASILPDNMLVCVALDDPFDLGVLSSRLHVAWALGCGGTLEDRPRYTKSSCFDPFPFPDASEALKGRIRAVAEELDALRKQQQSEHHGLTLTQVYNVLEKLRAGESLDEADEAIKTKGLVLIVKELHDEIDRLVAEAYGWPADLADEEILARLVALNAERAKEEKRGLIRWLRPDFQRQRAGMVETHGRAVAEAQLEATLAFAEPKTQKQLFPSNDLERTAAVFAALMQADKPLDAPSIARAFRQGAKVEPAIARVLASLARLGHAHSNDGRAYILRRAA